jgi:hypothetical protein
VRVRVCGGGWGGGAGSSMLMNKMLGSVPANAQRYPQARVGNEKGLTQHMAEKPPPMSFGSFQPLLAPSDIGEVDPPWLFVYSRMLG